MTVYGYIRVSTARQSENHSPENQRREITRICLSQSIRPDKFLEDMGISGTRPFFKRPSLEKIYFDPGLLIREPHEHQYLHHLERSNVQ